VNLGGEDAVRGSYMARLTVTLKDENDEYINEQSGDGGGFDSKSAVVNEAVRRMRTGGERR
jgi:Arc/MetJ-type ribon-helix-helix transcriptional regulator